MSTKIQKDIVCPACGQTQKLEMYTSVNAEENPELRRDILRESMFDWECLHCGYTAQMAYPMIYHDPMNAFMICLRPSGAVSGAEPIPAVRALKKRSELDGNTALIGFAEKLGRAGIEVFEEGYLSEDLAALCDPAEFREMPDNERLMGLIREKLTEMMQG